MQLRINEAQPIINIHYRKQLGKEIARVKFVSHGPCVYLNLMTHQKKCHVLNLWFNVVSSHSSRSGQIKIIYNF